MKYHLNTRIISARTISLFICIIFFMIFKSGSCQEISIIWSKTYGAGNASSVFLIDDGGFTIISANKILTTDRDGNLTDTKYFDHQFAEFDQTNDGGFITLSAKCYSEEGDNNLILTKTNSDGISQWQKYYSECFYDSCYVCPLEIRHTNDNGCFFTGTSEYIHFWETNHTERSFLKKTDANGNLQWSASFICGGYGSYNICEQLNDDSFITLDIEDECDPELYKYNIDGNLEWQKLLVMSQIRFPYIYAHLLTFDNNIIMCGGTWPHHYCSDSDVIACIFKIDNNGNLLWERTFGDSCDVNFYFDAIQETEDKGYIISGNIFTYAYPGHERAAKVWLMKTDANGNKQWDYVFSQIDTSNYDKPSKFGVSCIKEVNKNTYIIGGRNDGNIWLAKITGAADLLGIPSLIDPVTDKQGIGVNLWLDWEHSVGATSYKVQVDDNSNFSSPVFSVTDFTATNGMITGLNYNTSYFWRIRANGELVNSEWSPRRRFTTMQQPFVIINQPNNYVLCYLTIGDEYFIDRQYTIHSIPDDLQNLLWIKTANNDKNNISSNLLSLQLDRKAAVYVAYDHRATSVPNWLSSQFAKTDLSLVTSDESTLDVWSHSFDPGTVTLGGNMAPGAADAQSNYIVLLDIESDFTEMPTTLPSTRNSHGLWGDYDNDGDLDILLMGTSNDGSPVAKIYRNDALIFVDIGASLTGVQEGSAAWGDYDNDNDLDLLITGKTNDGSPLSRLFRNDGSDTFVDSAIPLQHVMYSSVAWVDYDNDGDLDIFLSGNNSSAQRVTSMYRNDQSGIFSLAPLPVTPVAFGSACWGDYNRDGDFDLFLTGRDAANNRIARLYDNQGQGRLVVNPVPFPGISSSSVAWGDYDNDGDLDLLVTGKNIAEQATAKIFRYDGGQNFIDANAQLTGVTSSSAAWGDYDNDGDLDLLLCGRNGQKTTRVYQNNNGAFSQIPITFTGVDNGCAAWGDCDNDGDLDILLTGEDAASNPVTKIYRNDIPISNNVPLTPGQLNYTVFDADSSITFIWETATDSETPAAGLTYNLRVGTTPGSSDILSAMALPDGSKLLPCYGNVNHNRQWTLRSLDAGIYYWSVQSVDNGFAASPFSAEQAVAFIPVPVELAAFQAIAKNDLVTLEWITVTETTNLGFNIYRSENENSSGIIINSTLIKGAGTSAHTKKYKFIDRPSMAQGTLYYSLEQVDLQGTKTLFKPVQVNFEGPKVFQLWPNYPNPFNSTTTCAFSIPVNKGRQKVDLLIYDIQGHVVRTLISDYMEAGTHQVTWDGTDDNSSAVTSGIYYCQFRCEKFKDVQKMILLK